MFATHLSKVEQSSRISSIGLVARGRNGLIDSLEQAALSKRVEKPRCRGSMIRAARLEACHAHLDLAAAKPCNLLPKKG